MKFMWRITKYNPIFRDEKGAYIKDEWTSFSDIGKRFQGRELTLKEYEKFETLYLNAILMLMESNEITELNIVDLEVYEETISIPETMIVNREEIKVLVPQILRENIWCKLENLDGFFVHFGYDYNMYIGSNLDCEIQVNKIEEAGLFAEVKESPYL